jgi:glycosyltransferase involved in cell wall biosynthesis
MGHILYLVPHIPNPTKIRSHLQIQGLIESGQTVTVATFSRRVEDQARIQKLEAQGVRVIIAPLPSWRMAANGLLALPGARPLQAHLLWSNDLMQRIEAEVRVHPPDVIHVEHLRMAGYGLRLKDDWPVVWDAVDDLASLFRQASKSSASPVWRIAARIEAPRLQGYQQWLTGQFPVTLVISRRDEALLQQDNPYADRVQYAPLGIPLHRPSEAKPRADHTLIITGTMDYHPNIAAVQFFVRSIFPEILRQRPDIRLEIVGANPNREILALGEHSNITVTGFVPSVTDYLQGATIALAPVTYGAGIQIKVLEAFMTGTPLVATREAVRGLDVQHEEHLLVADHASDFAQAVIRLLNDAPLREQLAQAGRRYIEAHHEITQTTQRLLNIYQSLLRRQ